MLLTKAVQQEDLVFGCFLTHQQHIFLRQKCYTLKKKILTNWASISGLGVVEVVQVLEFTEHGTFLELKIPHFNIAVELIL